MKGEMDRELWIYGERIPVKGLRDAERKRREKDEHGDIEKTNREESEKKKKIEEECDDKDDTEKKKKEEEEKQKKTKLKRMTNK